VTLFKAAEGELEPAELVAVTVKVYAVPLVSPAMMIGLPLQMAVMYSGLEVTVYKVMALPPLETGAVKLTVYKAV
jgi:hypothetical protein